MVSEDEIEKAKKRLKEILSCKEEFERDYKEGHKSSFELDLEDFEIFQIILQHIEQLEFQIQAKEMVHKYDVNMIDEVKGEAVKLYKIIDKLKDKLQEDIKFAKNEYKDTLNDRFDGIREEAQKILEMLGGKNE